MAGGPSSIIDGFGVGDELGLPIDLQHDFVPGTAAITSIPPIFVPFAAGAAKIGVPEIRVEIDGFSQLGQRFFGLIPSGFEVGHIDDQA